jgi:hypothetical protein
MMTVFFGIAGVALGALAGAFATYVTTRSTLRIELEHSYDRALREKRLDRYEQLFRLTRCIPRYWLPSNVPTRRQLHQFREDFHDWYFGEGAGGMFLSPAAKDAYVRLLNKIAETMLREPGQDDSETGLPLSTDEAQSLRDLASELRHQLAEDVGTANPPRMRWTRLGRTIPPPSSVG